MNNVAITTKTWFIAHSNAGQYATGSAEPGQVICTGQTELERFTTEEAFDARCAELGICCTEPGAED